MGQSASCEDQLKKAYQCFKISNALSRQFQNHMKQYLIDQNCLTSNSDSCKQARDFIEKKVEADFKFAMKHFNDEPRPNKLTEIINTYPSLLQFLPKCTITTNCKVKL